MLIEQFQALNQPEHLIMTPHSRKLLAERGIRLMDIMDAIRTGEIIEDYPEDTPFPSCLILGFAGERVLHVCASIDENQIYLITAYSPDIARWETDWKTRKEENR